MKEHKSHNRKSTGFKTPDNYFESFESKVFDRLAKKETIKGLENHGFEAPKDYFDTLEERIFKKINEEDKLVIQFKSRKTFYSIAGIAASLIILLAVFFNTSQSTEILSVEMVEAYLANSDLNSYELAQLLSDADLLEENFTIIETNYSEDNLET